MKALKNTIFTIFIFMSFMFSNSLTLTNVDTEAGTLDVYMQNTDVVGGFQFGLAGVNITGGVQTLGSTGIPPGTITMYGGSSAPSGWQICNGGSASTSALQSVVGSTVPDLTSASIAFVSSRFPTTLPQILLAVKGNSGIGF